MWDRLTRIAAPAVPPVTLAEAKAHLKVTSNTEDTLIEGLIAAATATIDGPNGIGIALVTQTWRLSLHGFPTGELQIPLGPLQAITEISYIDATGASQVLPPADYQVDLPSRRIAPVRGKWWPPTAYWTYGAVTVTFTAGYGLAADVPANLKAAILLLLAHWFENREAVTMGVIPTELPLGFSALTERYRGGRFGS